MECGKKVEGLPCSCLPASPLAFLTGLTPCQQHALNAVHCLEVYNLIIAALKLAGANID